MASRSKETPIASPTPVAQVKSSTEQPNIEVPKQAPIKDVPSGLLPACLSGHNKARIAAGLNPLSWSDSLQRSAQSYAQHLQKVGGMAHSRTGENIYRRWHLFQQITCDHAMRYWLNEKSLYHGEPIGQGNFKGYAHYTQLMWPETANVGCGIASGFKGVVVCHYDPPGNVLGRTLKLR